MLGHDKLIQGLKTPSDRRGLKGEHDFNEHAYVV